MKKYIIEIIPVLVAVLAITSMIITSTDVTFTHAYVQIESLIVFTIVISSLYISLKISKNNSDEPPLCPPISTTKNGDTAVKNASIERYDLILMDCQMRKVDGGESTHNIRHKKGPNQKTPIIALTENSLHGDDKKCIADGINDYMSNLSLKETLILKINSWMDSIKIAPGCNDSHINKSNTNT